MIFTFFFIYFSWFNFEIKSDQVLMIHSFKKRQRSDAGERKKHKKNMKSNLLR